MMPQKASIFENFKMYSHVYNPPFARNYLVAVTWPSISDTQQTVE